ncbi:unnamed protein product [Vitrella brassicaformis CCMP3155]|uniref:Uncharacterized protein n=1 Tax=Vitrella brassicaformis (strain CCMP3155) TaxID=1169540 RepID=A0A0G4ESH0_VITBC|nr:unnamed protein product [Vitrella brassicaformis CCMP3155]|eukprot:CEM01575.1 unnamed protein product [Vitrella brassicaformis CCMP3155]
MAQRTLRSGAAARSASPLCRLSKPSEQQQHPVSYLCVGRRSRYLLSIKDIVRLRATCTWLRELFGAAQLRDRLSHSLGLQAGLRRVVNGQQVQLLRFDDDHFGTYDLLAAVCVMEEGSWVEIGEIIDWAGQCGNCDLPVTLMADDINTHGDKTAYSSVARVLAQLMVVGRHVVGLQIFGHANGEVRAIVNPPLPPHHLYQRHRIQHDPPVASDLCEYASLSSLAKCNILSLFACTHQPNRTLTRLYRRVGGGRLDGLLNQSPHTPVAGCTTTLSCHGNVRWLVLTNSSDPFVAWITMTDRNNLMSVAVMTTEAPVACESSAFKDRFPVTTQLARVTLGRMAPYVFDGQVDDDSDDDSDGAISTAMAAVGMIWTTTATERAAEVYGKVRMHLPTRGMGTDQSNQSINTGTPQSV